jgi:dephospho-CoA kinase
MCDDMKILGVCGGIGSGKSTACTLMVDALGCADRIGELALRNRFFCICKKI